MGTDGLTAPAPTLPEGLRGLTVALVHDWLVSTRGGESVLASLCRLFPDAPVFTLVHDPAGMTGEVGRLINGRRVVTSPLQRLPFSTRIHRALLPAMPYAVEALDLRGFDLVLSSSHCVAKGVIADPGATHVSYLHTPMRYAYEQFNDYFGPERMGVVARLGVHVAMHHLRLWDQATAGRVDHYLCNSHHVKRRIHARYRREATVVPPPVDLDRFAASGSRGGPEQRFLVLGALAPYKRVDQAIAAFNALRLPLDVAGTGQDLARLKRLAGPTVRFLGRLTDDEVARAYAGARALVFPGEEDFGITPLEAMASGTPVIALGRGGATETVVDLAAGPRATGVLYPDATVDSLISGIERFMAHEARLSPATLRARAAEFARPRFEEAMVSTLAALLGEPGERRSARPVRAAVRHHGGQA